MKFKINNKKIIYTVYMPYAMRKLPNQNKYEVYNELTGMKHSKGTTLEKAKKQFRLLHAIHNKDFKKKMLG